MPNLTKSYFVAAQNSRHRTAALALYRALQRTARKVPLPPEAKHHGRVHPISYLVRKRFQDHRNYTSLRLIYSTMTNGYKV
jgi:hypothetical protein